ncbi:MAG: hypothetical protein HY318_05170, partial [Armatimonadetes bacterium]|nr:hypothetical protein [Armatimonadota bacterium]
YQVQWTDTKEQKPIAVALSGTELSKEGYTLDLPAGMVRQVWFSFHPVNVKPGTYSGKVVVRQAGGSTLTVPLSLRVFPMTFPSQPTLHAGGWDYTDASEMYGVKPTNREMLIAHLQERFVDSPWGTSAVLPWGDPRDYDAEGNLKKDLTTTNFDGWVDRWPNARRYCVFVSINTAIQGENMGTPRFNRIVGSWINFWVKHAATKGLKAEQLVLLLFDEPSRNQDDEIIATWVKTIRAVQPKVVLWEDPTYLKPEEALPEMMTSVDVLCPNRVQMLMEGKHFEEFYRRQKAEGRRLDFYSCSGPMHLLDPYSYVRLQAWSCWDLGAESTFFWALGDTGGGNPWQPYTTPGNNYAPMFLAPDSVTPGKHMEAIRESVEDFEYFVMLRQALARAKPGNPAVSKANELLASGARRVLEAENASKISWLEAKDRWQADNVRREILEALVGLMK